MWSNMFRSAEVPRSPVSAGMVATPLPDVGARGYALSGRWANLPKQRAVGATTAYSQQQEPLMPAIPITLGAHVIAAPQAKISGLGGVQTGDASNRQPLYDRETQRTGYVGSIGLRRFGYGI